MLTIFLGVLDVAAQEASESLTCEEVQNSLKPRGKRSRFTGWCRADIRFESTPVPGDVVTILDDARPFFDACAENWRDRPVNLIVTVTAGNLKGRMRYRNTLSDLQVAGGRRGSTMCIEEVLESLHFPDRVAATGRQTWLYRFTWHYVYPLDLDLLIGPPEPLPIPSVDRGSLEIE